MSCGRRELSISSSSYISSGSARRSGSSPAPRIGSSIDPRLSLAPYPPSRRNHHTASQASGEPAPPVQVLPRNGRDLRPAAVLLPLENSGRAAARPHGQGRGYHHPCASFQQPPLPQYSAPPPPSHATPGSTAPPSSYQSQ